MEPNQHQRPRGEDGYTLIELMVIIVIVAILIAGATYFYMGAKRTGATSQAVSTAQVYQAGVDGSRLVARGYGETQPLQPGTDEAVRSSNRRVEFHILRTAEAPR